jgi:hypothetical protein
MTCSTASSGAASPKILSAVSVLVNQRIVALALGHLGFGLPRISPELQAFYLAVSWPHQLGCTDTAGSNQESARGALVLFDISAEEY